MLLGCFFPHLWPLGLPQRESSSLELVQNCQMLPPEHSCICPYHPHHLILFNTRLVHPNKTFSERTERSQPVTSQWNEVPKFHGSQISYDFQWMFARSRRRGQNETTFLGPTPSGPSRSQRSQRSQRSTPNQQGQRFKQRVMVNRC